MAKNDKKPIQEEAASPAPANEFAKELEYEASLDKPERKAYRKAKRKQNFAKWVDMHWFPFLLFCALILLCSAITILLSVYNLL